MLDFAADSIRSARLSSFRRKIQKFLALDWRERFVFCASLLGLPFFWLGLRLFGLPLMLRWSTSCRAAQPLARETARAFGRVVNQAAVFAPGPVTCLTRSLWLLCILSCCATRAELRIGVRFEGKALLAHAWVVVDGMLLNDSAEAVAAYASFDGLPDKADFK